MKRAWMARLVVVGCGMLLCFPVTAQLIVTNLSGADAFVRSLDTHHTYCGVGAWAVSGLIASNVLGQQQGALASFMRLDASGVAGQFNTTFGAGRWTLVRVTLDLFEQGAPNNTIFNRGVGPFQVQWVANDS